MKKEGMVVTVSRCKCCSPSGDTSIYIFTKGRGINSDSVNVCTPFLKGSGLDLKGKFPRKVRVIFQEMKEKRT